MWRAVIVAVGVTALVAVGVAVAVTTSVSVSAGVPVIAAVGEIASAYTKAIRSRMPCRKRSERCALRANRPHARSTC